MSNFTTGLRSRRRCNLSKLDNVHGIKLQICQAEASQALEHRRRNDLIDTIISIIMVRRNGLIDTIITIIMVRRHQRR